MILKTFELNKIRDNAIFHLLYGKNEGLKNEVINNITKNKKPDCRTRDESFIYTKMEQLKNDVVGIQLVGYRQYLVTYIKRRDMSSGNLYLDYSDAPCY